MWETNAGLTERHAYDSRPLTWPVLRRGINFWTKDHRQVYLIGNPFIWWGSLCAIMVYLGARALLMLRAKRGCKDFQDSVIVFYDQTAGFLTLGWMMHFLPFFAMHRQLFIHHYLPALYFSILLFAVLFDVLTSGLKPKFRFLAALAMISIAFISYSTYAPITYATPWTTKSCERARLLKTWDLNCKDFPDTTHKYYSFGPGILDGKWKNASVQIPAGSGAVTSDVVHQAAAPQAGNHPFEQAPQKVAPSSGMQQMGSAPVVEQAKPEADKVQPDVAPPEPAPPVPKGSAEVPAGQAVLEAEKEKQQQQQGQQMGEEQRNQAAAQLPIQQQQQQQGGDLKGLDQEGLEGVVMSGTASNKDKVRPSASAATTPSLMATPDDVPQSEPAKPV